MLTMSSLGNPHVYSAWPSNAGQYRYSFLQEMPRHLGEMYKRYFHDIKSVHDWTTRDAREFFIQSRWQRVFSSKKVSR